MLTMRYALVDITCAMPPLFDAAPAAMLPQLSVAALLRRDAITSRHLMLFAAAATLRCPLDDILPPRRRHAPPLMPPAR